MSRWFIHALMMHMWRVKVSPRSNAILKSWVEKRKDG